MTLPLLDCKLRRGGILSRLEIRGEVARRKANGAKSSPATGAPRNKNTVEAICHVSE